MIKKNKLIVTIDGIRKDRLGIYNNNAIHLSKNLTRISKQSIVFNDMMACATSTAMCFASLFSGRYQKFFNRKKFGDSLNPFKDNVFTDHENKGYITIVSLNLRFKNCFNLINTFGDTQYWWTGQDTTSKNKNIGSLRPLEQAKFISKKLQNFKEPYLLWVHLWGFSKPEDRFLEIAPFDYDARVAELDEAVGYIFDKFHQNSEIFIFADHGYAFFEQSKWAYGKDGSNLTESVCSVPAIIYNGNDSGFNNNLVSQIELRKIINDSSVALNTKNEMSFCETRYLDEIDKSLAIRKDKYKLIYNFSDNKVSFFDLNSDCNENIDLNSKNYHKVTRDSEGNHPPVKPFIIRSDWNLIQTQINEMKLIAENFYDFKKQNYKIKLKNFIKRNKFIYSIYYQFKIFLKYVYSNK